ncbi:TPA: hypothetical protein ACIYX1_004893 [Escherichia coli]
MQLDEQEVEKFRTRVAQLHEALDVLEQTARKIVMDFEGIAGRLNDLDARISRIQDMYTDVQRKLK